MASRLFVDTLFVLALLNDRDQFHRSALDLSHRFETSLLLTTDAVLLEIGNAMSAAFRQEAAATIGVLRNSARITVVEIRRELFDDGLEVYRKHRDKKWSLVDCISFIVMRKQGVTDALTFDADFKQAGFVILSS